MTKIHQYLQTINDYHDPENQLFQIYYLAGLQETGMIIYDTKCRIMNSHIEDNPPMRAVLLTLWEYTLDRF